MVAKSGTERGYFTDKYTPLPETSQAQDGPPPPPPPPPSPSPLSPPSPLSSPPAPSSSPSPLASPPPPPPPQGPQVRTPLQPGADEGAIPQPRRMQRTQHHQTPPAYKRHSGGGRTRLSSLSESTASREALEHEGTGFGSQTPGATKTKNTSSSQQETVRKEQTSHQPKKQPQALTGPSPIDNATEPTNNQGDARSQPTSNLPRQRPITNVSEQATTQEHEPQAQTFRSPRQQSPPDDTPTSTLTDKPVPRSSANRAPLRPAATGPRSREGNKKDPSTPPVRRNTIDLEKLRANTLRNIKLPSEQAPGEAEPTEGLSDAGTGGTEQPGKQGSQPRAGREQIMRETARMKTNLQNLAGKKGPKQEPKHE